MRAVPEIVLNSGRRMPVLGMGTATYPIPPEETVFEAVVHAMELGYRHFDSASLYQSERPLGRAISFALERGLIRSRDELFITTKLWCTDMHGDRVVPALRRSLGVLGLEYVDLYLIHMPVRLKGEMQIALSSDDILPLDISSVWQGMEECQRLGLVKSIGVSNFTCKKLAELLTHAEVLPAVNQVEMHPLWQQRKLQEFCKEKGIHISAYSPLGGYGVFWGTDKVLEAEEIKRIAHSMGKSIAQVCLRWAFEQGVSFLPKSFNKGRLKENGEIFDWCLSAEAKEKLSLLPQERLVLVHALVSPDSFYKSHADFWDGEM